MLLDLNRTLAGRVWDASISQNWIGGGERGTVHVQTIAICAPIMGVVLVEPILCDALGRVWVISLVRWIDPFVCPLAERICEGINFPSKEACTSSLHEIVFVGDVTRQLCTFSGRRVMPMSKRMRHNRSANNVGDSIVEQSVGSSQAIVE